MYANVSFFRKLNLKILKRRNLQPAKTPGLVAGAPMK